MRQFISRDFSRTEHDDYVLNVQPLEGKYNEALPIYENKKMIGWLMQPKFS